MGEAQMAGPSFSSLNGYEWRTKAGKWQPNLRNF